MRTTNSRCNSVVRVTTGDQVWPPVWLSPESAQSATSKLSARPAEVLASPPWDLAEANALIVSVEEARQWFSPWGWPVSLGACRQLGDLLDRVDAAFLARNQESLSRAVAETLDAIRALIIGLDLGARDSPAAIGRDPDPEDPCPGSAAPPPPGCPGCSYCQPVAKRT
jgi:hypothetical protein